MKRIFPAIAAAMILCGFTDLYASGDYKTHEFYAGYGEASLPSIAATILDNIAYSYTAPFSGSKIETDQGSYGPISGGYNYYFNKHISLGIAGSYEVIRTRWEYNNGYTDWNWNFGSAMLRFNVTYGFEWFQFYHGVFLGGTYTELSSADTTGYRDSDKKTIPAGHLALLGIRIGKELGIYADLGIGTLGIVNFGASYRF